MGRRPAYREAAEGLGRVLAERALGLVYGGGAVGLMGVLANAALVRGGEVVGVIPAALVDTEVAHPRLTELRVVPDFQQRKALMADLSDAFVALPGGYGTLDELFEALTWSQLGMHDKPVALLDVEGYFEPLVSFLDGAVSEGFVHGSQRDRLLLGHDPETLVRALEDAVQRAGAGPGGAVRAVSLEALRDKIGRG